MISRLLNFVTIILVVLGSATVYAADTLTTNQMISRTSFIASQAGYYVLNMDPNGTLRILRSDGSLRYQMATGSDFAVMQGDGNFVQYKNPGQGLWATGTYNGLRNTLVIHDDGDLVVYTPSPAHTKIWNIGSDYIWGDPSKVGDVVGRDLAYTGAGYVGHVGIWDGGQIFEADSPVSGNNAITIKNLFSFKHTVTNTGGYAQYWGTASYNVPAGTIHMTGCWDVVCNANVTVEADARYSIALRAMQAYRIGADYTVSPQYVRALFKYGNYPMQRGIYRCDTFIIDMLEQSTFYWYPTSAQQLWINRFTDLKQGTITPGAVYNKLKTFQ